MPKTMHIPPLGAELTLAADWTFTLYDESRNEALFRALKKDFPKDAKGYRVCYGAGMLSVPATLPAGTVLTVRRYYIRQGQGAFDSVTFSAKIGKKSHRFWAKLADVNNIQLDSEEQSAPNPAGAAIQFALEHTDDNDDAALFLRYWNDGEFDKVRRNWPLAPEEIYIGADPLYKPKEQANG